MEIRLRARIYVDGRCLVGLCTNGLQAVLRHADSMSVFRQLNSSRVMGEQQNLRLLRELGQYLDSGSCAVIIEVDNKISSNTRGMASCDARCARCWRASVKGRVGRVSHRSASELHRLLRQVGLLGASLFRLRTRRGVHGIARASSAETGFRLGAGLRSHSPPVTVDCALKYETTNSELRVAAGVRSCRG